jgi:hypothetical protein
VTRLELLAVLEDEMRRPVPPARRVRATNSQLERRVRELELRVMELETRSLAHRCGPERVVIRDSPVETTKEAS